MKKKALKLQTIGMHIEVLKSKNKTNIGIKGKIIDETKNTIVIRCKNHDKRLFKENITIKIDEKIIDGKQIKGRIEERLKTR